MYGCMVLQSHLPLQYLESVSSDNSCFLKYIFKKYKIIFYFYFLKLVYQNNLKILKK